MPVTLTTPSLQQQDSSKGSPTQDEIRSKLFALCLEGTSAIDQMESLEGNPEALEEASKYQARLSESLITLNSLNEQLDDPFPTIEASMLSHITDTKGATDASTPWRQRHLEGKSAGDIYIKLREGCEEWLKAEEPELYAESSDEDEAPKDVVLGAEEISDEQRVKMARNKASYYHTLLSRVADLDIPLPKLSNNFAAATEEFETLPTKEQLDIAAMKRQEADYYSKLAKALNTKKDDITGNKSNIATDDAPDRFSRGYSAQYRAELWNMCLPDQDKRPEEARFRPAYR